MRSNNRFNHMALLALCAIVVGSHWPWQHRLRALEHELDTLRQQVAVQQAMLSDARPVGLDTLAALSISRPTVVASLPTTPIAPETPKLIHVARAESPAQDASLDTLNDRELDTILAGEGPAMPALPAAMPGASMPQLPTTSEPEQSAVNRPVRRVERGGVLLPKGRLQVEPTFSYTHVSNNQVQLSGFSIFDVVFIGEISSDKVDRDIYSSSVAARYGITNRLQGEIEIPNQYQRENVLSGPIDDREERTSSEAGFGDVRAGLFYQLTNERGWLPAMISRIQVKPPTGRTPSFGSGTWGVKTGLTMLKRSDPVVLFSNIGHTLNLAGDVNGVDLNPGNSFELGAGLAYALNYNLSINGGFEQVVVGQAEANGTAIKGSRVVIANFKTGLTYALSKNLSMDLAVSTGLTEASPDVSVSVSFPYTF